MQNLTKENLPYFVDFNFKKVGMWGSTFFLLSKFAKKDN
jgi:hypothetical protein